MCGTLRCGVSDQPGRKLLDEIAQHGVFLSIAGFAWLWFGTNQLAALLGLFTLLTARQPGRA